MFAVTIPIATALFSSGLFLLLCLSQWHSENAGSATGELQSAHQPDLFGPAFRASPVHSKSRVVEADIGIVAADDERCSIIGRNALRDGGNAVDAAVATTLCLGVVSPESSGLGGGAFMLVRMSTGQTIAYDMRESAPGAASEVHFLSRACVSCTLFSKYSADLSSGRWNHIDESVCCSILRSGR